MQSRFRKMFLLLAALVLLLAYAAVGHGGVAGADQDPSKNGLAVNGTGKVSAKPDIAYITVGVTSTDKTARAAQDDNNKKMSGVIAALKGMGLKDDDIRTVSYDLSPRYEYTTSKVGEQKQQLVGYVATNQVQVTVREVNLVGKALDSVVSAGANLNGGIAFGLSEAKMEKAYADALTAAYRNAKSKADVLAKNIGVTLGKPKEVSEGGVSAPPVYRQDFYAEKSMAASEVPVAAGQLEVSASVGLRYEY